MITLNKIIIENYKSIQKMELDLGNLNVFVGPNNVGKSNIFDCLNFLAQFMMNGAVAINLRGGFSNIVWNGELHRDIIIQVNSLPYSYRIEIAGRVPSYYIKKEIFSLAKRKEPSGEPFPIEEEKILEFPVETGGGGMPKAEIKEGDERKVFPVGEDNQPVLPICKYTPPCGEFIDFIKKWSFYNFVPQEMRMPLEVVKSLTLNQKGENISQVLLSLHSEYPEEYKRIEEILQSAIDEIKTIHTPLEMNKTYIAIQEKDTKIKIPSWLMSDGTLKLLALLSALYTPVKATVVCLEEPENYIHPHLMDCLTNVFKNVLASTQILISTHSPYLLNLFELENLIIVEKKHGATQIKYAKDEKGIKDALTTLGLGELWYSGSLGGIPE